MRGPGRIAIMLAALVLLAGCGSSHVVKRSDGGGQRGPVSVSKPKYGATTTVQRGQNLYRIATDNGITLRDLAAWNGISPPYTIYPGQHLRLYPGGGASSVSRNTGSSRPPPRQAPKPAEPMPYW